MEPHNISKSTDFRNQVFNAIYESVNLSPNPADGNGVHIGIIDSVYHPPDWAFNDFYIRNVESFVDADIPQFEFPHGMLIFDLISRVVPNAAFSFYQVVGEERDNIGVDEYTEAIDAAIADEIDILNISLGAPNKIPPRASPYYPPIERAIESDIIPVAAIGNLEYEDGPRKYIYSPANIPAVVGVGGCETICPVPQKRADRTNQQGPYSFGRDQDEIFFCGQQGCVDGGSCIRESATRPFPNNTVPFEDKPDVLAPAHVPTLSDTNKPENVNVNFGTSFAAPVVVGAIAKALCETDTTTKDILEEVNQLLESSGQGIDDYPAPKLDAFNFMRQVDRLIAGSEMGM